MPIFVVMPVYNAAPFILQAIESVLGQTYKDLKLIVLDDGSTDNTLEIAQKCAAQDGRVEIHTHANVGTASTLNRGIELVDSEWIFLMHADDVMRPNRLERQLAFIQEHPELAVVSSLVRHIDSKGRIIGKDNSKLITPEGVERVISANGLIGISHPAVALRKSAALAVGGYRQAFWPAEDIDLWNRLVEKGYKVLVQPEYLLDYRMHGNSASISRARLTRTKVRWLKECMLHRRAGKEEPDWETFLAEQRAAPFLLRMNRNRKDLAKAFYKAAVLHYAQRQYLQLCFKLMVAVGLQPGMTVSVVISKFAFAGQADDVEYSPR
jgi:glycosyltransferase involved in cell wall biosynthesis